MTIIYKDQSSFYDGIRFLAVRNIEFEAHHATLTIQIAGAR